MIDKIILPNLTDRNGRKYSQEELEKQPKSVYGSLDARDPRDLDTISHRIDNLRVENGNYVGTFHFLETPLGKIAKSLVDSKVELQTNIIGLGKLTKTEDGYLVEDFTLIGINLTYDN